MMVGGTELEPVTPSLSSLATNRPSLDACGQSQQESGTRTCRGDES
jgi:hypothetical protein